MFLFYMFNIFLAVAYVSGEPIRDIDQYTKAWTDCLNELGHPNDFELIDYPQGVCVHGCAFEKLGLLVDNKFVLDGFLELADPNGKQEVTKCVNSANEELEKSNDKCVQAFKIFTCFKQ